MTHPLTPSDIAEVLGILDRSRIARFRLSVGATRIVADRTRPAPPVAPPVASMVAPADAPAVAPAVAAAAPVSPIRAPLLGVFGAGVSDGAAPAVGVGTRVDEGTAVGTIRVLDERTVVRAGLSGVVTAVLAQDGAFVEYGQPLFDVRPDGGSGAGHDPSREIRR